MGCSLWGVLWAEVGVAVAEWLLIMWTAPAHPPTHTTSTTSVYSRATVTKEGHIAGMLKNQTKLDVRPWGF